MTGEWFYVGMAPHGPVVLGPFHDREQADATGENATVSGKAVRAQDIFTAIFAAEEFER